MYQWRSVVLLLGGAQNLHISKKSPNLKFLFKAIKKHYSEYYNLNN